MFEKYSYEADFALKAVRWASGLCQKIQGEKSTPALSKSDRSPVTVADFASQAVIARMLNDDLPADPLVAEEDSQAIRKPEEQHTLAMVTEFVQQIYPDEDESSVCARLDFGSANPSSRFWTLDPIDGTKGFLRGGQYVVALALIEEGQVVLGALGCPNLNTDLQPDIGGEGASLIAVEGQGAWVLGMDGDDASRLRVSDLDRGADARILRSFAVEHTDPDKLDRLVVSLGTSREAVLMDSQAKYALLAAGRGDLLFRLISPRRPDYEEFIWDQASGSLIVTEAGGRITDLNGRDLDFTAGRTLARNTGVVASNGRLHEQALRVVQALQREDQKASS